MEFLRCSCPRIALADQHAQELGDQGGLRLAFDLQRALQLEQHPPTALRFGREELARMRTRAPALTGAMKRTLSSP